jgi:hypothetical protein
LFRIRSNPTAMMILQQKKWKRVNQLVCREFLYILHNTIILHSYYIQLKLVTDSNIFNKSNASVAIIRPSILVYINQSHQKANRNCNSSPQYNKPNFNAIPAKMLKQEAHGPHRSPE